MKGTYAYFPGCSAKGTCSELDLSTQSVAALLGLDLVELENAGCTGAREFRALGEMLHLTANGRILALAERVAPTLVVVCDTCLLNLTEANQRLKDDAGARRAVNAILAKEDLCYEGSVQVKHFLWVLAEEVGEEALRARVVRPLTGLRVAPFYGCHIQRPEALYKASGARAEREEPSLDWLCRQLGAEVVQYEGASKCCGFHVVNTEQRIALTMSGAHLAQARGNGAQCVVTPCPLCHTVLDAFQPQMDCGGKPGGELPVLHASQLAGLALGLAPAQLGLGQHVVSCERLLAHVAPTHAH